MYPLGKICLFDHSLACLFVWSFVWLFVCLHRLFVCLYRLYICLHWLNRLVVCLVKFVIVCLFVYLFVWPIRRQIGYILRVAAASRIGLDESKYVRRNAS